METDKMLERLARLTESQLGYRDYRMIDDLIILTNLDYDTSKLTDKQRENIRVIFNKYFEVV